MTFFLTFFVLFRATHEDTYDLRDETKKDQFYLNIQGISSIDFGNKNRDDCIKSLRPGHFNGIPTDMAADDTLCVAQRYFVT